MVRRAVAALIVAAGSAAAQGRVAPAPIGVRVPESAARGVITVGNPGAAPIAKGEIVQTVRDGEIVRRISLQFVNGARFEETVAFTQRDVFHMTRYELSQHGPPFRRDLEGSLTGDGKYVVRRT